MDLLIRVNWLLFDGFPVLIHGRVADGLVLGPLLALRAQELLQHVKELVDLDDDCGFAEPVKLLFDFLREAGDLVAELLVLKQTMICVRGSFLYHLINT